jgi:hypothetical protein
MDKPTFDAQIAYIKEKRQELQEWIPLMRLQDWDTATICHEAEKELETLKAIEENLIGLRFWQAAIDKTKAARHATVFPIALNTK